METKNQNYNLGELYVFDLWKCFSVFRSIYNDNENYVCVCVRLRMRSHILTCVMWLELLGLKLGFLLSIISVC